MAPAHHSYKMNRLNEIVEMTGLACITSQHQATL